ncbi:MAG: hypothetical protein RLN72_14985 [Henriciella sp.]
MILRRLSKHVKDQNWFAVGLDFLIVVLGVFIGLQVQQWSERRATDQRTAMLMERLEADFGVDVWVAKSLHEYHQQVLRHAQMMLDDLTGRETLPDDALLIAAHRASQFNRFNRTSGIYEELVASGGLELVSSSDVGVIATLFYKTTILDDYEQDGKSSEYRQLYRSRTPIDVQAAVDAQCGDRARTVGQMISGDSVIGYPCTLDFPADRLAEAAAILRQEPALRPALRLRIATLATQNRDFGTIVEAMSPYAADRNTVEKSSLGVVFGVPE